MSPLKKKRAALPDRPLHPPSAQRAKAQLEADEHDAGGHGFRGARNVAAREIALAFGVPPMLLGIPGDATYANYREANSAFWRLTVLPLVNKAARAISGWLGARVDGGIVPELNGMPAFQDDLANQWARIDAASFLTVEEKRRLAGL